MRLKMTEGVKGQNYSAPFLLIILLFLMWGFAHSMLDVLNKHFQLSLHISLVQSTLVQNAVYGGYFLMALPAGRLIMKWGYRSGVLTGLLLFGLGALLFVPLSALSLSPLWIFYGFVVALFILGCGLTCLETSANPYATVLGAPEAAERRINFAQSFNGLGWVLGPLVGLFLFRDGAESTDVAWPYLCIGVAALLAAVVFSRVRLPEVTEEPVATMEIAADSSLRHRSHFCWGVVALLLYVAAQTGINSFFINFATDAGMPADRATLLLSFGCMTLFMLGRLLGTWLLQFLRSSRLLLLCAIGAVCVMGLMLWCPSEVAIYVLPLCYLFESIMFPTIFSLSIKNLGREKKRAGSYLIMSIVGGAIAPTLMATCAQWAHRMAPAFVVPLVCFVVIAVYAWRYPHLLGRSSSSKY